MPNMEERSETRGDENQTVGYSNQNAGDEGQMHRGLLEPLEGEIQISGDISATSWGLRSNFLWANTKSVYGRYIVAGTKLLNTQVKPLGRRLRTGLNEPLKGEIQSAEGTSVISGDSGPTSVD